MFTHISNELLSLVEDWEIRLRSLTANQISKPRNSQSRNIRQIIGHMVDSASNNTHRVVHLQYRELPLRFPNYATYGNNEKWISIQNYENENWENLVSLWKFTHLHFVHVIQNIRPDKLKSEWISDPGKRVTLDAMVEDFPRHFHLHLNEIQELIKIEI